MTTPTQDAGRHRHLINAERQKAVDPMTRKDVMVKRSFDCVNAIPNLFDATSLCHTIVGELRNPKHRKAVIASLKEVWWEDT